MIFLSFWHPPIFIPMITGVDLGRLSGSVAPAPEPIEPTQVEIDGVAEVFADFADDAVARQFAYIVAKKLKSVFVKRE